MQGAVQQYSEEFINAEASKQDLANAHYLKAQYFDERLDAWLMLLFKKTERTEDYYIWDVIGICEDDTFDDSLWEDGDFKGMFQPLNADDGDWVVDAQISKMRRDIEVERWLGSPQTEEFMVKDLLKNYKLYRAETAMGKKKGLAKQLDLLDECVGRLWDEKQKSVILQYLDLGSIAKAAKKVCLTKAWAQYQFEKAVGILELLMSEEA